MSFKSDLLRLSGLRLLLGTGVGLLFFGVVNLFYDPPLAVGFLVTGGALIAISVVGHRRLGDRAMER